MPSTHKMMKAAEQNGKNAAKDGGETKARVPRKRKKPYRDETDEEAIRAAIAAALLAFGSSYCVE